MTVPPTVGLYLGFLAALCAERCAELVVSRRNERRSLAKGGVESGRGHYLPMVAVHALFPAACAAEVLLLGRTFPGVPGFVALVVALLAQALRWWVIATLGERWCTRVIVVPGVPPVTGGPFRFLRHPNYLAVVLEVAAVPSIHGAFLTAAVFSGLNALLLGVRIPVEEEALGYSRTRSFAGGPRG